jgi:hypothetical protein
VPEIILDSVKGNRTLAVPERVHRVMRVVARRRGVDLTALIIANDRKTKAARREAMRLIRDEIRIAGKPPSPARVGSWFGVSDWPVLAAWRS